MEQQLEEIRDQQKQTWNKFSPGWKKWDQLTMEFLKPMGEAIIKLLQPKGKEKILDIAAGTGEPGLTIAAMLKDGEVIITDLAEEMLVIARENAIQRNIKNIQTVPCDVCDLPFEDETFDAISCRFGFMFFPDMELAAKEMFRVLKPGGRIATSVWNGPEKNFWITASMGVINKNIQLPAPAPGAPGMFRCAAPGAMNTIFQKAGFSNIKEKEVTSKLNIESAETYWKMMTEIAAPIVAALGKADEATKKKVKEEVLDSINKKFPDGKVAIDASANVIYAEK